MSSTYASYINGKYCFLNSKDVATDLFHTFVFDEKIRRVETIKYDQIFNLINQKGGYIVVNKKYGIEDLDYSLYGINENTIEQYSNGEYYSCSDYYFFKGFSAIVYNNSSTDSLTIEIGLSPSECIPPRELMPDHYAATTVNKMLGRPSEQWCGVGSKLFTNVIVDTISGIKADYYAMNSWELEAAYGVHSQKIPWLYYPMNEKAAKGVGAIFSKNIEKFPAIKNALGLPTLWQTYDLGEDGLCFTQDVRRLAVSCKNQLQLALNFTSTEWSKIAKNPGYSNDDINGCFLFCSPSRIEGKQTSGVVYTGKSNIASLELAIFEAMNDVNATTLNSEYGYIVDQEVNSILTTAYNSYLTKLNTYWKGEQENFSLAGIEFLSTAKGYIITMCDEYSKTLLQGPIQILNSDFRKKGSTDELERVMYSSSGIDVDEIQSSVKLDLNPILPTMPKLVGSSTVQYKDFVRDCISKFGADSTVESPIIKFGDLTKATICNSFNKDVVPKIEGSIKADIISLCDLYRKGSVSLTKNTSENEYSIGWGKTEKQYHDKYGTSSWSPVSSCIKCKSIDLVSTGEGIARATIKFECLLAEKVWYENKNTDFKEDFLPILQHGVADNGWNFTWIGYGKESYTQNCGWWHDTDIVTGKLMGGYVHKTRTEEYKSGEESWWPTKWMNFEVSKDIKYDKNWNINFNLNDNSNSIIDFLDQTGNQQASLEFLTYLIDHIEILKKSAENNPIVLVDNHYVSPVISKMFFTVPLLWISDNLNACRELAVSGGGCPVDKVDEVVKILNDLAQRLCTGSVNKVRWMSEEKALNPTLSVETDLIPTYIFFTEDKVI